MLASRRAMLTAALLIVLVGIGGCVGAPPGRVSDSHLSFDRTFDMALGAMADQRMTFSTQDRRQGRIVGTADGATLVATLQPMLDGTIRVNFVPQGDTPADTALLKRVADAYTERMAKLGVLGVFRDSDGASRSGPTPCPNGPAFCP
jgi:hypothetical protein